VTPSMRRLHLFEIEDQSWCPPLLRDALTGILEHHLRTRNVYGPIVPRLKAALEATRSAEVLDLCSGSGGPWMGLLQQLGADIPIRVRLTDKFPNTEVNAKHSSGANGRIVVEERSIDATDVPSDLRGFRTLFTALHHFRPPEARAIIEDACRKRVGIGVFEHTERSREGFREFSLAPIGAAMLVPALRPFRWPWLPLTYLLPLIPFMALIDGLVSCVRTYSTTELGDLVKPLERYGYTWEIGQDRPLHGSVPITYLIGYPTSKTSA
jgi:hypothetical protein